MKKNLIISSGIVLIAISLWSAPSTQAPINDMPISASFLSMTEALDTAQHKTYRELLDYYLEEQHDLDAALDTLEKIPSGEISGELIRLYEARIAARSLDLETAETLLKNIKLPEVGLLKAVILIAQKKRDEAEEYLHYLASEHPSGEVKSKALSLINAFHVYDKHREAHESYLWTLLAQKLEQLGEWELSGYLAERVIKESPEYRDGWIIKGINEIHLHNYNEAESSVLQAYQRDPGNGYLQYLLGIIYQAKEDYELSTQYLTYSQKNTDKYQKETLELLAQNAQEQEQHSLSLHYYEQLLSISPDHKSALLASSWLLVKHLNQPEKALKYAELYAKEVGKTTESQQLLSWINGKLGNIEDALNILEH